MKVKPRFIIQTLKKNAFSVSKTARELGIHRTTIYRWITKARFRGGLRGNHLKRISTKPRRIYRALTPKQEFAIIALRKDKGHTASKIKYL